MHPVNFITPSLSFLELFSSSMEIVRRTWGLPGNMILFYCERKWKRGQKGRKAIYCLLQWLFSGTMELFVAKPHNLSFMDPPSHLGALMHFPNQLSLIFFLMYLSTATRGSASVVFNISDLIYFYIKRKKCAVSNTTHKPILMKVLFVKSRAQSIFEMKIQIVWSCNLQRNCC